MENTQNVSQKEISLDVKVILRAVLRRLWIIVLAAVLVFTAVYMYCSWFVSPVYASGFTTYINNRLVPTTNGTTISDLNASMGLAYVYQEVLVSRSVLTEAAEKCGVDLPYSALASMVTPTVSETAPVISVYVYSTDPRFSRDYATAIAEVAPNHVNRVVEGSAMQVIDPPLLPASPVLPRKARTATIGAVIGGLLAVLAVVLLELLHDKVQDAQDLENRYQVLVLGSIPDISAAEKHDFRYYGKRYGKQYGYGKNGGGKQ